MSKIKERITRDFKYEEGFDWNGEEDMKEKEVYEEEEEVWLLEEE